MIEKILFCTYSEEIFSSTENAEKIIFDFCKSKKINCYQLSPTKFVFYRRRKIVNIGQEITIDIEGGYWSVVSKQVFPSFYDFSSNYYNVRDFMLYLDEYRIQDKEKISNEFSDLHSINIKETKIGEFVLLSHPNTDLTLENLAINKDAHIDSYNEMNQSTPTPVFLKPNEFVNNRPPFYANLILIGVIILVYLLMIFSSKTGYINQTVIRKWGANHDLLVANGEIHRLLMSIFVHISAIHMIGNILILYLIGSFIEKWLSSKYYILHFLSIGFFAAGVSFYFHDGTFIMGSSSAVFGILGMMVYATIKNKFPKEIIFPIIMITCLLVLNLYYITSTKDINIDHVGHLSGFSFGFLYAIMLEYFKKNSPYSIRVKHLITPLIAVMFSLAIVKSKPNHFYEWKTFMDKAELYKSNGDYVVNNYYYFYEKDIEKEVKYALECYDKLAKVLDSIIDLSVPNGYKEMTLKEYSNLETNKDILYQLLEGVNQGDVQEAIFEIELKKKKIKLK